MNSETRQTAINFFEQLEKDIKELKEIVKDNKIKKADLYIEVLALCLIVNEMAMFLSDEEEKK